MFGDALDGLTDADLGELTGTVPTVELPAASSRRGSGSSICSRAPSSIPRRSPPLGHAGRRYVNNHRITQVEHQVTLEHLATETMLVVRGGKKTTAWCASNSRNAPQHWLARSVQALDRLVANSTIWSGWTKTLPSSRPTRWSASSS